MAELPHTRDYFTTESHTTVPTSPRTSRPSHLRRRTPSPPAPTIYLRGFSCIASDREYEHARRVTGNVQPYWFGESFGPEDHSGSARRKARNEMMRLENEVADIYLNDVGNETDRPSAREKRNRERRRDYFSKSMLELEGEEHAAVSGSTSSSRETQMKDQAVSMVKKQWEKLEKERIAEKQKKKNERRTLRIPIRNYKTSLRPSHKKFRMKGKSRARGDEIQPEVARERGEGYEPEYIEDVSQMQQFPPSMNPASMPSPTIPVTPATTDIEPQDESTVPAANPRSDSAP